MISLNQSRTKKYAPNSKCNTTEIKYAYRSTQAK